MIEKLNDLKTKIAQGNTTAKDIDIINELINTLGKQEEVMRLITPELNESEENILGAINEPVPAIVINTINIYVQEKNENEAEKGE